MQLNRHDLNAYCGQVLFEVTVTYRDGQRSCLQRAPSLCEVIFTMYKIQFVQLLLNYSCITRGRIERPEAFLVEGTPILNAKN